MTPEFLYKYRPIDARTMDIVVNHRIYFPSPATLNDPYDCKLPLTFESTPAEFEAYMDSVGLPASVKKSLKAKGIVFLNEGQKKVLSDKYLKRMKDESSLFCASEVPDDLLMFSHYADSHRGCCLEFKTAADPLLSRAEKVKYETGLPDLNFFRLHRKYSLMARRMFLTKAQTWAYEKEWRVWRDRVLAGFHSIKPSCLTGIILGSSVTTAGEKLVRDWVSTRGVPVSLRQASLSGSGYSLKLTAIP